MRNRKRILFFAVAFTTLSMANVPTVLTSPASAQSGDPAPSPYGSVTTVERDIGDQAIEVSAEIERARQRAAAKNRELRALQRRLAESRNEIDRLSAEERRLSERILHEDALSERTLTALIRLGRPSPVAMRLTFDDPLVAVRSSIALRSALLAIGDRLEAARAVRAEHANIRQELERRRDRLESDFDAVDAERRQVIALLEERAALFSRRDAGPTRTDEGRQPPAAAADLEDLVVELTDTPAPDPSTSTAVLANPPTIALRAPGDERTQTFGELRGTLPFPAFGRLIGSFGETEETGVARKGIVVETDPGAVVVAPFPGQVVFAGPFRGYGRLLIIDHGEGYHTLLVGLGQIFCVTGQVIDGGEPVATMPYPERVRPDLYIEVRHDNRPIDPLPWFSSAEVKVRG